MAHDAILEILTTGHLCPACAAQQQAEIDAGVYDQPGQTFGIFDAKEDPADRERALFVGGFASRAAAQGFLPVLKRSLDDLGMDIDDADLRIRPE